ncbi:MAG: hypothetical protein GQ549_01645 [Gammaproteobacteria bacterium]|nr:hypothetical protein [Gammaproteobacteria bacterium]
MKNKLTITLLLFISFVTTIRVVEASNLDDAVDAMRTGDFAEAYCIMRPLADDGDPDAQYNIGWMYLNGYGLRVNDSLALEWWEKASEQGNADASFSIGMLYSLGDGEVPKDTNKAIDYYLLALKDEQEDAIAILKSMMLSNNRFIRVRLHSIMGDYAAIFGIKRQVKARKLNARAGSTTGSKIVAQLLKEDIFLEMEKQGKWSHGVILGNEDVEQTVWVYNPLLQDFSDDQ